VPIKDWPQDERPREKLIRQGAVALSDAELLALFLRTGTAGRSAVDVSREALSHFGGLSGLFSADYTSFAKLKGLGPAKYAQIQAILEMTKRTLGETLRAGPALGSSRAVRDFLALHIGSKPYEVFFGLFLDAQHRLLDARELFRGTLTQTSVYPREVVKAALAANAAAVVLAHNHPAGSASPSPADVALTEVLERALDLVDVRILDHLIIAGNQVFSFAEDGRL
jgi:DNA repair protein RadC